MTELQDTQALHDLTFKRRKRMAIFNSLSDAKKIKALSNLSRKVAKKITAELTADALAKLLESTDPDEATDILRLLPDPKKDKVVELINENLRNYAQHLLQFDPQTAAGLMSIDYVQVELDNTIAEAVAKFRIHEKRTGRVPAILVIDDNRLIGILPLAEMILARPSDRIDKYVKDVRTIHHHADQDRVMKIFRNHPHDKVVVINEDRAVLGIIYSDNVLSLLQELRSDSLFEFAGINDQETVLGSAISKVKFRARWLIINLFTAFIAAFAVSIFDETIAKYVVLAIYMPIVAGMGGNAATQTLAVVVRGIALKQISLRTGRKTLRNEIIAGFINGCINAVIVAAVVMLINHDVKLALVLSLAMIINLVVAGIFGTLTPLVMAKLGKDPASSATVFITTATDVLGFIAFLGLGQIILG